MAFDNSDWYRYYPRRNRFAVNTWNVYSFQAPYPYQDSEPIDCSYIDALLADTEELKEMKQTDDLIKSMEIKLERTIEKLKEINKPEDIKTNKPEERKANKSDERKANKSEKTTNKLRQKRPTLRAIIKQAKITEIESNRHYHGKLEIHCIELFQQAYGLNGYKKISHNQIFETAMFKYECSKKAVFCLLYGQSYKVQLQSLRSQIPDYESQEDFNQDVTQLSFYEFDGNSAISHIVFRP